jgi:hypothetical protein
MTILNPLRELLSTRVHSTPTCRGIMCLQERKLERKASDVFDHSKDESGGMSSLLTTVDEEAPLVTSRLVHGRKQ